VKLKTENQADPAAFKGLINTQLDIIADRLKYLEEFEDIVIHEKKQIEVGIDNSAIQ
jgi:hypothetical protein